MSASERFTVQRRGDVTVINLADERLTNPIVLGELKSHLMSFVEDTSYHRIVLDFEKVQYCTSQLVEVAVHLNSYLPAIGGTLKLCMKPNIREVFRIMHLDKVFDIHDSLADALDAYQDTKHDEDTPK